MLGVASSTTEAEHLLTVERGPDCVMAALQSGANLLLSRGQPGAVEALVEQLSADTSLLPGVIGPARTYRELSGELAHADGSGDAFPNALAPSTN